MLSTEENELLTRTGPGTPMGGLIRRYWIPALLSEEVPEPDCPPVRLRLLGEDLVAFRDSEGRIGLLDEHCSHRGTSLFFGRNEDCGLRCIYHGWKYDIEGHVVDTPAEPPGITLKNKVRHNAYPCREAAGAVFTYMGPKEKMPLFPNYEWLSAPPDKVSALKFYLGCNYLQCLEGDCDSSHTNFLHSSNFTDRYYRPEVSDPLENPALRLADSAPSYEMIEGRSGIQMAAIRKVDPGSNYVRTSCFVAPIAAIVPVGQIVEGKLDGATVVHQVPSDDNHTWRFNIRFRRKLPIADRDKSREREQVGSGYRFVANSCNHYLQDRQSQKSSSYTGIKGFTTQDACVTESMGPIMDRRREHLGISDSYIIQVRKFLLQAVRGFQTGEDPPGLAYEAGQNYFPDLRSEIALLPPDVSWKTLLSRDRE
jgi:phenylpropionate dioxygenase-like ring-hydroxylating dioxygenase large terminal subunit